MILRTINTEIENFKTKQVQIMPGLYFNQYDTIKQIYFHYNSKFETGEIDEDGDRKYFKNINRNPCKVYTKSIDFDTKDIRLLTVDGADTLKTWLMERDLKYWMRDQQFGKTLNRIFTEIPVFGSVVVKFVKGTLHFVDLRNFIVDQRADTLLGATHIIEIHKFTPAQFQETAKSLAWDHDKVEQILQEFFKMRDESHIRVYERYGMVNVAPVDAAIPRYEYRRVYHADVGVDQYDQQGNLTSPHPGVELANDPFSLDELRKLYWEFHAEKIPGRWLGYGVVEALFEPQYRVNELTNLQAKGSYWAALRIFQTRDGAVNRNLFTDVRNGEILNVDQEITQIDMTDRNLAFFNQQNQDWMQTRDELTFSYDAVQGNRLPAGTPLGSAQLATAQALSYFETIQENIALDVKEMLFSVVIPEFEAQATPEHTLRIVGQDLDEYIEMVKNDLTFKEVVRQAIMSLDGKPFPTNHDRDVIALAIAQSIKQGKEKILTIPKGTYQGVKYTVDIDITGESVDTRVRYATRFAILQAITADPTTLTDPTKKKIIAGMAEDGGLNPSDFFGVDTKAPADLVPPQMARAGGGVSAPALASALPGTQQQTL